MFGLRWFMVIIILYKSSVSVYAQNGQNSILVPWIHWTLLKMRHTQQGTWHFSTFRHLTSLGARLIYLSYSDSAERKGLYGASLSGLTWVPLASLTETPEKAREIIDSLRERIEGKSQAGLLPPGLKEQYDLQLEELETRGYGDCEILFYPRYFGIGGMSAVNTRALRINLNVISHVFSIK